MPRSQRRLSYAQGYLELGMLAEAAAELAGIVGPDAQQSAVIAVRLAVLHEQQNWAEACVLAGELARRDPTDAGVWIRWAYATRRADSLDAAEKILRDAELHHPSEPTIQFNLGCYACQRGDLKTARARVDRAIALEPEFAQLAATDPDLAPLRETQRTDCQPDT